VDGAACIPPPTAVDAGVVAADDDTDDLCGVRDDVSPLNADGVMSRLKPATAAATASAVGLAGCPASRDDRRALVGCASAYAGRESMLFRPADDDGGGGDAAVAVAPADATSSPTLLAMAPPSPPSPPPPDPEPPPSPPPGELTAAAPAAPAAPAPLLL
jgi:hypothetical protein